MTITHGGDLFAIARQRGWDWREVTDFSASINPLGPSPRVRPALLEAMDRIVHYPDRHSERLTKALADEWNIDPDGILLGNGATDLIHFLARAWPQEQTTLLVPVFSEFHRAYPSASCVPLSTPDAWPKKGLLIFTNPVNPTGAEVRMRDTGQPVLVDESFIEFSSLESRLGKGGWVLRSLTKFQALPGLRIGALTGPPSIVRRLKEQREPWQVNVLAEAAALEAINDKSHAAETRSFVGKERDYLLSCLAEISGVCASPSHANFLLVRLEYNAAALRAWLLEQKILVRNCAGWPGVDGEAVRIAVRTRIENEKLIRAWREFACD